MSDPALYFLLGLFAGGAGVFLFFIGLFFSIYRKQMESQK